MWVTVSYNTTVPLAEDEERVHRSASMMSWFSQQ
jgi:hypothetical protein